MTCQASPCVALPIIANRIIVLFLLFIISCTDSSEAYRTLEASGFTDIQTGGYNLFACAKDDWSATEFSARNPNGVVVRGVVCCGLFKSCTVRF